MLITSLLAKKDINIESLKAAQESHLLGENLEHPARNQTLNTLIESNGIDITPDMTEDEMDRITTTIQNATGTATPLPRSKIAPCVRSGRVDYPLRFGNKDYSFVFDGDTTLDVLKCYILSSFRFGTAQMHKLMFHFDREKPIRQIYTNETFDSWRRTLYSLAKFMLPNLQSLDFFFARESELNFFMKRIEAFLEVASTKEDVIYDVECYGGHLVITRLYHYLKQNNNKTLNICLSLRKLNDCISWLQEQSGTFHFETFNVYIYNYPFDDTLTILFPIRGQQFARDLQKEKSGGRINTSISNYKKSDVVRSTISLLSQRPFKNIKLHFDHSKFLVKERTANGLINCIHALIDEIEEKMHPYYNITNIEEKILTLTRIE